MDELFNTIQPIDNTIYQPPPFSTVTANDPIYKNARFYALGPDGKDHEYLPPSIPPGMEQTPYQPYMPQPPQYATQGTIQPQQGQIPPSPYAVQTYQPVQYQYPQFVNDPSFQQTQADLAKAAATNFLVQNQKPGKWDGVKVFAQKIAPVVGAVLGGGAVGGSMAQQSRQAIQASRNQKLAQQQNAISSLNAVTNFIGTLGIRPLQQAAKAQNQAAQFNAGQQNRASNTGLVEQGKMQRQANNINFQGWKYMDNKARLVEKDNWNRTFKQFGLQVDMDQFERNFDQKERFRKSALELGRIDRMMRAGQHSDNMAMRRAELLRGLQQDAVKMEMDVEQFNGKMEFDLAKAQQEGKLPPDFDPQSVMLEFNKATSINPADLGMSPAQYQGFIDQLLTAGNLGEPMPADQGLQAQAMSLNQPQQQQPVVQQGMAQAQPIQAAPQAIPQQAPAQSNAPFRRGSLLNAKPGQMQQAPAMQQAPNGQAAMQMFKSSKRNPAELKQSVIRSLMNRGVPYQQALQMAGALQ